MKNILFTIAILISTLSIGQVPDSLYTQPINIIVSYDADMDFVKDSLNITVIKIPEMIDGTYSLILKEKDDFDYIEEFMEQLGDVTIIGTYRMDGLKYQWKKAKKIKRNHSRTKYHSRLRNKKTYDEEGNILTDEPYTLIQADSIQVNIVAGWKQRKLLNQ